MHAMFITHKPHYIYNALMLHYVRERDRKCLPLDPAQTGRQSSLDTEGMKSWFSYTLNLPQYKTTQHHVI